MRKHIWIEARQEVKYAIGLEIGKDISQEEADKLLEMDGGDFREGQDEWYKLQEYLTDDTVCDWYDLEDVEVYIEEDVRKV
jgi:hypothetical protein